MIKKCKECGLEFSVNENIKRLKNKKFCTRLCAQRNNGKSNLNKFYSDEINKKKGRTGVLNSFFGKKHTALTKLKISDKNKWNENKYRYCNLDDDEKEILEGILLSDGCLSERTRISARLTFGFKYIEMVNSIIENLPSLNFSRPYQDKKTKCWHSKSKMYHDLLFEHNKWYVEGKKIIPKNIILSPKSLYWWYIGDGYISEEKVYLCTDSYTGNDVEFLVNRLKLLGFNCKINTRNRIYFNKIESKLFLKCLSENNQILDVYKYKWKIEKNV